MYLHFIKARQNTEPCTMKNTRGVNHDVFVSLCVCVCVCVLVFLQQQQQDTMPRMTIHSRTPPMMPAVAPTLVVVKERRHQH